MASVLINFSPVSFLKCIIFILVWAIFLQQSKNDFNKIHECVRNLFSFSVVSYDIITYLYTIVDSFSLFEMYYMKWEKESNI